jgi:hypothetical protein
VSRTLWVLFGSLLAIALVGWGAFNVVELLAHEERTERFTVPAADLDQLLVDNSNGSVTIVGTDADEVAVTADISRGLQDTGFSREVVDSTLELRGTCPAFNSMWCRVTLRIEVPRDLAVVVDASNSGVEVADVDGDVSVDADNGRVDVSDLRGALTLSSDNGRVTGRGLESPRVVADSDNGRVTLEFTSPPDSVIAESDNGRVEVAVPDVDGGYDVSAESDNGSVDVEVEDDPDSPRTIRATSDNGSVRVFPTTMEAAG